MGFFNKAGFFNKKDEKNEEKNKDVIASIWKKIPLIVKLQIILGLAGILLIIIVVLAIVSGPLNFLGYSDESQKSDDISVEYDKFWKEFCDDDNENCTEEQKKAAEELKKSQEDFYKKLDSLVSKYNITKEQKYIVLTTIFYNYDIDDFTEGNAAFELDDNDEIDYSPNTDGKNTYEREKDSLKELVKHFQVKTAFCEYKETNANGQIETKTYDLRSPTGNTFSFNFFDNFKFNLGFDPEVEGFKEAKEACLSLTEGRVFMQTSSNSAASIDGYFNYLRSSTYLDDRAVNRSLYVEYAKNNNLSDDISTWPTEDLVNVRERIINDIKSIVATYNESEGTDKTYLAVGSDIGYWWPIGSADVYEVDGKFYATGTPYPYKVTSEYGPRIHPITGKPKIHYGIDIAPSGAASGVVPVIAAKSGVVTFPNVGVPVNYGQGQGINGSSYGNYIKIQHTDGNYTLYGHLAPNSILVRSGDSVEQGQVIAYVGSSGSSTGVHLHFEVSEGQDSYHNRTNPRKYIDQENPRPQSSVSTDFVTWFEANFEGSTGTDPTGTKYLVKDVGDGVKTAGPGINMNAQYRKFEERGINIDDYPYGSYIDIEIIESIQMQVLEELFSYVESTLSNAELTLEKEKIEALVVHSYNTGNINGFVTAYKKYGDTDALFENWFLADAKVKGKVWPGLVKRREKEWQLFHYHVYV